MASWPEPLSSVFVLAVGLVLGSFLNVCIYRLPRGKSIVRPGSACPACAAPLRWWENLPGLSWVLLGGRCSRCGVRISLRYPLVEGLSGILALGLWHAYGPSVAFLIALFFALALVVLFFTDLDLQLLPDGITLTCFVAGVTMALFNPFLGGSVWWERLWLSLSGAALGSGLLWGVGALYGKLRGVDAMGFGDVKMMAMVGAFTGPLGVLFTIFTASAAGALVGVALIPLRGRSLRDTLPFGCFLAPSALAALVAGRRVVEAYFRLVIPAP
jgi:leader peptidase (prepilin peptidase)/N-methyltransferase